MAARGCSPSGPTTRMTLRRACIRCLIDQMSPLQMCRAHGNLFHGSEYLNARISSPSPLLQAAIDSCPVSCIHWVQHEELAALEWVMQVHMSARPGEACGAHGRNWPCSCTTRPSCQPPR